MKKMKTNYHGKYHHIVIENMLTIRKIIANRFKNTLHEQVVFRDGFITTDQLKTIVQIINEIREYRKLFWYMKKH